MKIYYNRRWVDMDEMPLIIHLEEKDKENIKNMNKDYSIYCEYNKKFFSTERIRELLKEAKDKL